MTRKGDPPDIEPVGCDDVIDFYDNGELFACDREEGHTGRHAFRSNKVLLTWGR